MSIRDRLIGWSVPLAVCLAFGLPVTEALADPALDGAALFKNHCAACHDNGGSSRAPARAVLASHAPNDIFDTLTQGSMKPMAAGLSEAERDAIALYLTGKPPVHISSADTDPDAAARCKASRLPAASPAGWNGWSPGLDNGRFQTDGRLTAADVPRLKVKWAFAFAGGIGSQPTVVGGRVYLGTAAGRVYALDARTGCIHWRAETKGVRAAVSIGPLVGPSGGSGPLAAFVADRTGTVHALDAASGRELWSNRVETHPFATITGSPVLYHGRLYVPLSSSEEISTYVKGYQCCTFRGSVVALDASSGKVLWRTFTIDQEARPYRTASDGRQMLGPAGAAIWSAPTVDAKRGLLYVATGDSYTDVPNKGTDAVFALDLATGAVRWSRQITADDNYLVGCGQPGQSPICPQKVGPDHDFGSSPILRDLPGGRSVLLAGQKSGEVTAFDPDHEGAILWRVRPGYGGPLGGIEWGMAADKDRLFLPVADLFTPPGQDKAGMYAADIATGRLLWSVPVPPANCAIAPKGSMIDICTSGLSAAATAIPGLVIEGSMDGILRAYDAKDGRIVWSLDIGQASFRPINAAAPMKGDTMNGAGATVAGGTLFQISGYKASNVKATNLLLAFTVDGK